MSADWSFLVYAPLGEIDEASGLSVFQIAESLGFLPHWDSTQPMAFWTESGEEVRVHGIGDAARRLAREDGLAVLWFPDADRDGLHARALDWRSMVDVRIGVRRPAEGSGATARGDAPNFELLEISVFGGAFRESEILESAGHSRAEPLYWAMRDLFLRSATRLGAPYGVLIRSDLDTEPFDDQRLFGRLAERRLPPMVGWLNYFAQSYAVSLPFEQFATLGGEAEVVHGGVCVRFGAFPWDVSSKEMNRINARWRVNSA